MTAFYVIVTYLLIGLAVAVRALHRGEGLRAGTSALLLWPFTLPFALGAPAPTPPEDEVAPGHSTEIHRHEQRLEHALKRARGVAEIDLDRVARMAARLGRRLRRLEGRIAELEGAIAEAPAEVRGPLEDLCRTSHEELASGLRLMEALTGKLTLLAFADLGSTAAPGGELDEVRGLLERLEAMACATREVAAVHA